MKYLSTQNIKQHLFLKKSSRISSIQKFHEKQYNSSVQKRGTVSHQNKYKGIKYLKIFLNSTDGNLDKH